jgi:hypothetical protein
MTNGEGAAIRSWRSARFARQSRLRPTSETEINEYNFAFIGNALRHRTRRD